MKWIKCSERMPGQEEEILFFAKNGYELITFDKNFQHVTTKEFTHPEGGRIFLGFLSDGFLNNFITFIRQEMYQIENKHVWYWMPLPELPTD